MRTKIGVDPPELLDPYDTWMRRREGLFILMGDSMGDNRTGKSTARLLGGDSVGTLGGVCIEGPSLR